MAYVAPLRYALLSHGGEGKQFIFGPVHISLSALNYWQQEYVVMCIMSIAVWISCNRNIHTYRKVRRFTNRAMARGVKILGEGFYIGESRGIILSPCCTLKTDQHETKQMLRDVTLDGGINTYIDRTCQWVPRATRLHSSACCDSSALTRSTLTHSL